MGFRIGLALLPDPEKVGILREITLPETTQ